MFKYFSRPQRPRNNTIIHIIDMTKDNQIFHRIFCVVVAYFKLVDASRLNRFGAFQQ